LPFETIVLPPFDLTMSPNFDIFFKDLSRIVRWNPTRVFLGLGSNIDDRECFLKAGLEGMGRIPKTRIVRVSSVYETDPWGLPDQGPFLNQVVEIGTRLDPILLLKRCVEIEKSVGSLKPIRWGPRRLDVDILVYGALTCRDKNLELPHPRLMHRRFVLEPFAEIAPGQIIPGAGISVADALSVCVDPCRVRKWDPET
jgi:2-amino-4-hydroxy-6-hydroxymethyldihydropteridine diphosphokinase